MRFVIGMILFVHGFAHTVGFVVPWRTATLDDAPYKTTVMNDKIDVATVHSFLHILLNGPLYYRAAGIQSRYPHQPRYLGFSVRCRGLGMAERYMNLNPIDDGTY